MKSMQNIRKYLGIAATGALLLSTTIAVRALPVLQLGIIGGSYENETVVTYDNTFTLVAYGLKDGTQNQNGKTVDISKDYYISVAITPQQELQIPTPDIGSFDFGGVTYDASDLIYGTSPLDDAMQGWDAGDLPKHGIFATYFIQSPAFSFSGAPTSSFVNVQDDPGFDPTANSGDTLYYRMFDVDASNLAAGYFLHFDLYNTNVLEYQECTNGPLSQRECSELVDMDAGDFAPFSHDAAYVPEPAPLALMGIGLLALVFTSRRKHSRI